MKLTKISIHGFKSFADKVTIDIKDGITGIVGPNGSGKSNIVDAIKWALGEQSLKDIRGGEASSDLIFSGSKTRSPLTRAWVSLTFDNSDHYLNSDLNEIEIKRVVYSSGENEYFINNSETRLKDITNLFIDSGTSVNSLSIISQGKIANLLNGKPEEKRSIIEEAAGVLKYKKRKEETLRKLDKTNDNLERITLIIDELEVSLEPLKEQAEVAKKYLEYKENLEHTEIALLAYDINSLNELLTKHNNELEGLNTNLLKIDNNNVSFSSKIDNLKHKLLKVEDEINTKSEELFKITKDLSNLNAEKQIMAEREKYQADDAKLQANIVSLKESELRTKNIIDTIKEEIKLKESLLIEKEESFNKISTEYKEETVKKNILLSNLSNLNKQEMTLKNEIDILKEMQASDGKLPYPVKSVINNRRLNGVIDVLGKVLDTEKKYSTAIDIALGYTANVVIVNNEESAKESINYLKQNGLGRATFYPLNIIKPKGIDSNTLSKISNDPSFIGVASDLVKYDPKYRNVVLNALGNTIIVDSLSNANYIGKLINHTYKIVTLDGDLISAGGSYTGGTVKAGVGLLNQKYEIENKIKLLNNKVNDIKIIEDEINIKDKDISILESKIFEINNEISLIKESLLRKNNELENASNELNSIKNEINGTKGLIENNLSDKLQKLLDDYYKLSSKKDSIEINVNELKEARNDYQSEINELEINNRKQNADYNKLMNEIRTIESEKAKEEIKIDNYLIRLSEEYGMTFDKAKEYELDIDLDEARTKVGTLKRDIKALGEVNTGSISEYERINTRWTFLSNQREDLNNSINDLLSIINDLDNTMKEKLTKTFNDLNNEFNKVFRKLFQGGEGNLILTNPDDILNTGLEIKAVPPGKEIKKINLLSGGENTLTAIALLFAVLNIRTVPFCILDEVEAALDEVNVDMFGKYLNGINSNTQFIIITHKKRTMEYTNNLYGITMQEQGVSKLVSVKLD